MICGNCGKRINLTGPIETISGPIAKFATETFDGTITDHTLEEI